MARLHLTPYPMPPTSDLVYEQAGTEEALSELLNNNHKLEEGSVKGACIQIRFYNKGQRGMAHRKMAYYYVIKEKPLTFQWVPVPGHAPADEESIRWWRKANVLEQVRLWCRIHPQKLEGIH